ncbi:lysophospholipid acyltransferase family protein [Vitiosangium sp. GDMCC 1.1324]|uniref:lysophospholipid acyltransferase family protein n=1 Tax=Vitiosangium sp. (strain GDMCC 1.1324) TaxID=2138576 RepID=UPI000D365F8B|nr:lysophospholipid acyltransferase family protein [Vitiosangium sp. GDMCC 1.1324]PTL83429.1 lipid A biosynthesis acyltransferase [Vitiosangium sp. GDMCC 1.1324]
MSAPAPSPESPPLPLPLPPARLTEILGKRPSPVVGWLANRVMDAVCALPAAWRDGLARFVGWLAFTLGIRRRVALENLAHAYPEKSEAERRAIALGAYITMARVVIESIDEREHVETWWEIPEVQGPAWEALKANIAKGQGALLVTAHFGNWERAGKMLLRRGVPLNALVRPLNGALNMRIVDNRIAAGAGLIYPKGAIAQAQEAVQLGETVLMLLDQSLPAKAAVFVPFFGRPASTTPAMAVVAQRSGAPVFVVMGIRDASGRKMRLEVEGPIRAPEGLSEQDAITAHTAAVTAVLEQYVRRYPDQWLWLHRRWKVQPPPEGSAAPQG